MNKLNKLSLIETDRLILRPLRKSDASAIYAYFSQEKVMTYYDLETFTDIGEADKLLDTWEYRLRHHEGYRWGITLRGVTNDLLIGTCGFHNLSEEHNRAEIGYEIHPGYWGRGLATEACKALIDYGFSELACHRIEAYIDPQHAASRRVLHKSGLKTEGVLLDYFFEKGRFVDAEILSVLNKQSLT